MDTLLEEDGITYQDDSRGNFEFLTHRMAAAAAVADNGFENNKV